MANQVRIVFTVNNNRDGNETYCGPWHDIRSCNEYEFEQDKQTIMERNCIDEAEINNVSYQTR